jgi:signal peptidase I
MGMVAPFLLGLWAPLLAISGRWRAALIGLGLGLGAALVNTLTVVATPLLLLVPITGWIYAIRMLRRGRPPRWRFDLVLGVLAASAVSGAAVRLFVLEAFRVPSSAMCPTLRIGDHFWAQKLWGQARRGQVVVFVAPDGRDFVSRIVAVGGEAVAVRDGVLFIDGKPMPTRRIGATTYANQRAGLDDGWQTRDVDEYEEALGGGHHRVLHHLDGGRVSTDHDFPKLTGDDITRCEDATPARSIEAAPATIASWPHLDTTPQGCRLPTDTVFMMGDNRDNASDSRVWGPVPVANVRGALVGIWLPAYEPTSDWGRFGAID